MQTTYSLLTVTGRNKEAASLANATPLVLTEMAFGDGDRLPTGGETSLENELIRKPITAQGVATGAPNASFFDALLGADDGPFVIREGGLFDQDGDMVAIIRYDPPINKPVAGSGQNAEAQIRSIVAFSDLENLVLQIEAINAYVSAERQLITQDGVKGGGDLSADRTFSLDLDGLDPITSNAVHMTNDVLVLHDKSSGTHKKITPTEAAKALGGAAFASIEETVAGTSTELKVHPAGVKAAVTVGAHEAVTTYHNSIETRTTRLLSRLGL